MSVLGNHDERISARTRAIGIARRRMRNPRKKEIDSKGYDSTIINTLCISILDQVHSNESLFEIESGRKTEKLCKEEG